MKKSRSFDFIVGLLASLLLILLAGVLWRGDQTHPYIQSSSLAPSAQVSADLNQITLTFNREMDQRSVEEHFKLTPPISGQFSWVGRRMAYSFSEPLVYHQSYQLKISQAQDANGRPLEAPFTLNFSTPFQALFYINQNAQLTRYDVEKQENEILSSKSVEVMDYRIHPNRSTFYLLVKEGENKIGDPFISLYEFDSKTGQLALLVDGHTSKIFEFKVSPNGDWLAISVGKFYELGEFWVNDPPIVRLMNTYNHKWQNFWWNTLYETPLYFSNDSQFLLGVDYSGDALILPLKQGDMPPIQLGAYSNIHGLSHDGRMLLLSQEGFLPNTSLMVRKNDGSTQMVAEGLGELFFPAFDPVGNFVYFLVSHFDYEGLDHVESFSLKAYSEFFDLYRYNLSSLSFEPLMKELDYAQGAFDFSADEEAMVIERYPTQNPSGEPFSIQTIFEKQTPELWWVDIKSMKSKPLYFLGKKPMLD